MAVIDRNRWREIAPLLDQALDLADEERAAWLVELRSRSPRLAAELMALLAEEAAADREGFLHGRSGVDSPHDAFVGLDLAGYLQSALGDTYTIDRELGGGGMSRVFLARDRSLGREVVIKVLLPVLAAGIRVERFAREVRVAAALQHPNVVPLYSAGEARGLPYYVMPYVSGESLRSRLTRDGPLPLTEALFILRDVARALAFAHEQGVVHRDVKPENVLLAGDAAVVSDFGIAKALVAAGADTGERPERDSARDLHTLSAIHSTIGTPAYMSPEQVAADPGVDHRADLYAWGVVAYELLAGVHPFGDRTTTQDLLAAHLSGTPAPMSTAVPDLPTPLSALVMRCLEKDRARRPQSAREILDALSIIATPTRAEHATSWRVGRHGWRTALAGAAVLAVGLSVYLGSRSVGAHSAAPVQAVPTLAVLPFDDVAGDTADAYFGDGIADEIAAALSKVGGLRVASRTSAAAFRASHAVDVRELGRRLGVSTVLEGRVRRAGDRMRLTVQLTSVGDGMTLWSEIYERQVKDVFQVQDEVAQAVVGALRARLPNAVTSPNKRVSSPGTTNPEAYDLYLRATYLLERRGSGVAKAVEYFERAIAEDSTFARAYAGLAHALEVSVNFAGTPPRLIEQRATEAAQRALALDPTLAEAHTALGMTHMYACRWQRADEEFRRAVAADPGFAPGGYVYGLYLLRVGRIDEAEEPIRRARNADPLSGTASQVLAYVLSLQGRYDESLAESRRAYELDSSLAVMHSILAAIVLADGRPAEARALARTRLGLPFNGVAAYVLGATGDSAGAAGIVRELESRPHGEWHVARALSYAYLGLGDTARALAALEASARAGEAPIIPLADPMFDPVRGSPRFAAAVRLYGLDERLLTSPRGGRPR